MVSPIPQPPSVMYAAAAASTEDGVSGTQPEQACVDCAAEGNADALKTIYTVQGTVLCLDHAVAERTEQKENAR